jgi:hypothetical protein
MNNIEKEKLRMIQEKEKIIQEKIKINLLLRNLENSNVVLEKLQEDLKKKLPEE